MTQSLIPVALFVVLLACLPFVVKWAQQRMRANAGQVGAESKIISAVAVGPHQRVVTVEVGPEGARVWLTLGVTPQAISCLHSVPAGAMAKEHASSLAAHSSTSR